MNVQSDSELAVVIVNHDFGSKVLKIAKQNRIAGGTVFYGVGTLKNRVLQFLGLADSRKEIVIMAADSSVLANAIEQIDRVFEFKKPKHGIAFTMPLALWMGTGNSEYVCKKYGGEAMYKSIIVIVSRGSAEIVMEAATEAGARGGTVIKARGAGDLEAGKLFKMDIEPEKEIVLILAESAHTESIVSAIGARLEIAKPDSGVIFCLDVSKVYGVT